MLFFYFKINVRDLKLKLKFFGVMKVIEKYFTTSKTKFIPFISTKSSDLNLLRDKKQIIFIRTKIKTYSFSRDYLFISKCPFLVFPLLFWFTGRDRERKMILWMTSLILREHKKVVYFIFSFQYSNRKQLAFMIFVHDFLTLSPRGCFV